VRIKQLDQAQAAWLLDWDPNALRLQPKTFPVLTSQALFGNERPLEVEAGAGTGEFIVALAQTNPEINYLAIEVSHRAARYAAWLAAQAGVQNLRVLRADFKRLAPLLVPESWSKVYVHFPDPAHKRGDEKRILFNRAFLDAIAPVLVRGGELSVVSDKQDYFMRMLEQVEDDSRFSKAHPERYLEGFEPNARSRFQVIWERKGIVPLHFVARRA
jgi:tRNA (guanine-N7-)-methyltransferase